MVKKVSDYAERLRVEANHDDLSGLFNRRAFNSIAQQYFSQHQRYGTEVSVVMFDIDHFKKINDQYGHGVGDDAIKWVAQIIKNFSRKCDCVSRMGGEEFAILMPTTSEFGAYQAAEKIRRRLEVEPFRVKGESIQISISAGISGVYQLDEDFDDMMIRADKALYEAKSKGRNQVCGYSEEG